MLCTEEEMGAGAEGGGTPQGTPLSSSHQEQAVSRTVAVHGQRGTWALQTPRPSAVICVQGPAKDPESSSERSSPALLLICNFENPKSLAWHGRQSRRAGESGPPCGIS